MTDITPTFETDDWPYYPAKYKGGRRSTSVRHIVLHSTESTGTALAIARYFQNPSAVASTHVTCGEDGIFQSVYDSYVAYTAPGANHDGINIEIVGTARWSKSQWLSRDKTLVNAADACAQYCKKYSVVNKYMSRSQLRNNHKGITTHNDVSKVFRLSTHWDPGPNFPMSMFLGLVADRLEELKGGEPPPPDPLPPFDYEVVVTYRHAPDEGAARVLGTSHSWKVLPYNHNFNVGIQVQIGHDTPGDRKHIIREVNRTATARAVARFVRDKDWAEKVRSEGRKLAEERAKGNERLQRDPRV